MTARDQPRVLLISHDAQRTGAPKALLDVASWLRRQGISGAVALREDGPRRADFAAIFPTILAPGPPDPRDERIRRPRDLIRRARFRSWLRHLANDLGPFDVVYSNTCTNGELLHALRPLGLPVVTHAHEMGFWIDHMLGRRRFDIGLHETNVWVAASKAVADALAARGVAPETIWLVPEPAGPLRVPAGASPNLRLEVEVAPEVPVIVGAGTLDWRKGPDLFVQLARKVLASRSRVRPHFVWVGSGSDLELARLRHDVDRTRLDGHVTFLGERDDAAPYLHQATLLALTSREDPYPIVMLEAGAAGVPTIAFAASGGAEEFVAGGGGLCVPYLDVSAMAAAITRLLEDDTARHQMGEVARTTVAASSDLSVVGPRILEAIDAALSHPSRH